MSRDIPFETAGKLSQQILDEIALLTLAMTMGVFRMTMGDCFAYGSQRFVGVRRLKPTVQGVLILTGSTIINSSLRQADYVQAQQPRKGWKNGRE